jgi:DNA-binding XRE family transcriptional regulator
MKTGDWNELKARLLQDPEVKAAYDALEPEYELARQIIGARIAQNLTQSELAQKAGLKQTAISRLESGEGNPTFNTLKRVSGALGKKVHIS